MFLASLAASVAAGGSCKAGPPVGMERQQGGLVSRKGEQAWPSDAGALTHHHHLIHRNSSMSIHRCISRLLRLLCSPCPPSPPVPAAQPSRLHLPLLPAMSQWPGHLRSPRHVHAPSMLLAFHPDLPSSWMRCRRESAGRRRRKRREVPPANEERARGEDAGISQRMHGEVLRCKTGSNAMHNMITNVSPLRVRASSAH